MHRFNFYMQGFTPPLEKKKEKKKKKVKYNFKRKGYAYAKLIQMISDCAIEKLWPSF